ncbi:unnamed protein product, partial [Meganyctiphanes norvegica]
MEMESLDDLVSHIGVGRWTALVMATNFIWALTLPFFSLGGAFYNGAVDSHCAAPEELLISSNWTREEALNYSIPWEVQDGSMIRSRCMMYDLDYSNTTFSPWTPQPTEGLKTKKCDTWDYDSSVFTTTVAMEWNLVCDIGWMSPLFASFYFFGAGVGEPLMGFLSDQYGRRWVLRGSSVIFVFVSVGSALVEQYSLVLAGRFILGACYAAGVAVCYVRAMESSPAKLRDWNGFLLLVPFSLCGMLLGGLAYVIRDWRTLQLVCTTTPILGLFLLPFMDETPRWLVLKGRLEEAAKTLEKAARWHGVEIPEREKLIMILGNFQEQTRCRRSDTNTEIPKEVEVGCSTVRKEDVKNWIKNLFILVRTPILRRTTLSMFVCWFCIGFTYFGMSLSGGIFSENPFLYMVVSSIVEIPGYSIFSPLATRFGRRSVLSFTYGMCAISVLLILVLPASYSFILSMIGKLFITGAYSLLYLLCSELFPTCVRSRGLNMASFLGRIGAIIAPFIVDLMAVTYTWAPSLMFGICSAVASLMALALPESKGKPLTDTIEQLEELYNPKNKTKDKTCEK